MEKSLNETWQRVLAQIKLNISAANFSTWFKNTSIDFIDSGKVLISVPNNFSKGWLENKYNKTILKILRETDPMIKELDFVVKKSNQSTINSCSVIIRKESQLNLNTLIIDKETNLNNKYRFDNFIVGGFNETANAAALSVAERPGINYNPLFVYGGVGLGKTHLIQAIGNQIFQRGEQRVKYISSDRFTSEIVDGIRNKTIAELKNKYRSLDVFIIDDVQFLTGKEKTQEELFHIFNTLYEKNKQIIFSSDRPPKAISSIMERLRSRFEGGTVVDISFPDFETRLAILKAKSLEKNIDLPPEVCEYVAKKIERNIRELEGALNRLALSYQINNQLSIEGVKGLLKDIIKPPIKVVGPKNILKTVAEFYDLKEGDLLINSRKKEFVRPRQIVMYLLKEELKYSFPFIGRKLGGKDHTTVMYGYRKIIREMGNNDKLKEEIELIKKRVFEV